MSLTFLAKSSAYSWKMSFDGHVLWKRKLVGPWALTTAGAATAAVASAAPVMNLRRLVALDSREFSLDMDENPPWLDCRLFAVFGLTAGIVGYSSNGQVSLDGMLNFDKPWPVRR